jgi:competence protein ComEC
VKTFRDTLNRHSLILATLCYAAGIALSSLLPDNINVTICTSVLLTGTFLCWLFRLNGLVLFFSGFCFLALGSLHASYHKTLIPGSFNLGMIDNTKKEAIILGIIAELSAGNGEISRGVIDVRSYRTKTMERFSPTAGYVLMSLKGSWPRQVLPGDTVAVRAFFKKPGISNTPGTFNYPRHLARRNILVTATIPSPLFIQPIDTTEILRKSSFRFRVERMRIQLAYLLNELLPTDGAALYRALLIGDKTGLSPMMLESFKGSGVMHILAISGMHMALLGFILFQAIYWLLRRSQRLILTVNVRKLSLFICLAPLLGYSLLAGAAAPVMRSFVMAVFVITALALNRLKSPLTVLAGAGFFILVFDPLALESPSFQLSFAAVASIILFSPIIFSWLQSGGHEESGSIQTILQKLFRWTWAAISVTIGATLGTFPLLLYHFNRFSLVTIPANLIVEPLICLWALPLGFLALPFLAIGSPVAGILLQTGFVGLSLAAKTASFFASIPASTLWLPDPPIWLIATYYVTLILLFLSIRTAHYIRSALTAAIGCLLLFLAPLTGINGMLRQEDRVTFIDIGHGSASLIELRGGRTILIDGGGKSAPVFNKGERILAPFLWHRGIARIDDIIITHADADHYNGIPPLFSRFKPQRIWIPALDIPKRGFEELCRQAKNAGISLRVPKQKNIISEGGSQLIMLGSPRPRGQKKEDSWFEDDNGLIVKLNSTTFSVLFPGDITREKEQELVIADEPLKVDILLSPHHGSSTSNSAEFLSATQPDYMVVSTGETSPTLFPSPETVKRAEQNRIRVLTTATDGSITVSGTSNGYSIRGYRAAGVYERPIEHLIEPAIPR